MISTALLILFIVFYLFYSTSKKADNNPIFNLEKWINQNEKLSKIIGFILLLMSCIMLCFFLGLGVGIFVPIISLMAIGSLIVILKPLKIFKHKTILICFIVCFCIEFLFSNHL